MSVRLNLSKPKREFFFSVLFSSNLPKEINDESYHLAKISCRQLSSIGNLLNHANEPCGLNMSAVKKPSITGYIGRYEEILVKY